LLKNVFWIVMALLLSSAVFSRFNNPGAIVVLAVGLMGASIALGHVMNVLVARMGESREED
jgi:hypothetical protein